MITLKKHYTIALSLNALAISSSAVTQIKKEDGSDLLPNEAKVVMQYTATGIAIVAGTCMLTAHVRAISRVAKLIKGSKK